MAIDIKALDLNTDEMLWKRAGSLYISGDSDQLEKLLAGDKPIPRHIRNLLKKVVSGTVKRKRKTRNDSTISYSNMERITNVIQGFDATIECIDAGEVAKERNLEAGMDLYDAGMIQDELNQLKSDLKERLMERFGVSKALIEKVPERFIKRKKNLKPTDKDNI